MGRDQSITTPHRHAATPHPTQIPSPTPMINLSYAALVHDPDSALPCGLHECRVRTTTIEDISRHSSRVPSRAVTDPTRNQSRAPRGTESDTRSELSRTTSILV